MDLCLYSVHYQKAGNYTKKNKAKIKRKKPKQISKNLGEESHFSHETKTYLSVSLQ